VGSVEFVYDEPSPRSWVGRDIWGERNLVTSLKSLFIFSDWDGGANPTWGMG
jgi:hypothetical protein